MKIVLLSWFVAGLFAQTPQRTITVPVSRSVQLPLDQVTVHVYLTADASVPLESVVEALAFTGLTQADLREFNLSPKAAYTHYFSSEQPSERFGDILWGVVQLQVNRPDWLKNIFQTMGLTVSKAQIDEARRRLLPDLEKVGRAIAEQLAKPMGARVGALLSSEARAGDFSVPASAQRLGDFIMNGAFIPGPVLSDNRAQFNLPLTFALE